MKDKKAFSQIIENIVAQNQITYIEAIAEYCEKHGIEVETGAKLCNNKIKEQIKVQAAELNLIKGKKKKKLPI